jgi:hypothetical protein
VVAAAGPADEGALTERARELRRAAMLTAGLGAVHALLFLLALVLLVDVPGPRASDAEIVAFYSSDARRRLLVVGLYVLPFAAIAFMWFAVALRMWVSGHVAREDALLSNVQLVSGILFLALFLVSAAALAAPAATVELASAPIDPIVARQLPQYGFILLFILAMRLAAVFVFTTSNLGRTSGALPRWFGLAGLVVGAELLLAASLTLWLVLAFPLWLLTLSVILALRVRRLSAEAILAAADRPPLASPGRPPLVPPGDLGGGSVRSDAGDSPASPRVRR